MHAFFFFPIFYLQLPFVFITPPEPLSLSATSFHPTIGIFAPRHIAQAVLQKKLLALGIVLIWLVQGSTLSLGNSDSGELKKN